MKTKKRYFIHGDQEYEMNDSYYCSNCDTFEPSKHLYHVHIDHSYTRAKHEYDWFYGKDGKIKRTVFQRSKKAYNLFL